MASRFHDLHEPVRRPRGPVKMLERKRMVLAYRPIHEKYHERPLYEQLYKVMMEIRDANQFLSEAEIIHILEPQLQSGRPSAGIREALRKIVYQFRKWLGPDFSTMVLYVMKVSIKGYGIQSIYRPIRDKEEYMRLVGNHLETLRDSIASRHKKNLKVFQLTATEIEQRMQEISNQIDMNLVSVSQKKKKKVAAVIHG